MEPKRLNIGTHEARLQPVSAADIEALTPLVRRVDSLGARPGVMAVLDAVPDALTALAQLSAIPRDVLAAQHLAALVTWAREYLAAWIAEQLPYVETELRPLVDQISGELEVATREFVELSARIGATAPAAPQPAQPG